MKKHTEEELDLDKTPSILIQINQCSSYSDK